MPGSIPALCHEKLHVYQAAIEFLSLTEDVAGNLARGNAAIVDQLRRAAMSVCLNIAEGYGPILHAYVNWRYRAFGLGPA
jgi:hypothetical protein